jgi:tetratricopeptide (TPR) repeat protein
MLGALLFPADFASPIGYLGPQESTPYYPTGDLQRDRSVAFTTAVGCLDDLGVFLGKDNVRIADKLFKLAQALSDLGFREYALTVSDFALDVIEHLYFVAPNNYRPYVASVLSLRANIFCDLKRNDEAIDAADQAVKLCREHRVSQATPVPELPYASLNHALLLSSMGLKDESATVASELLNELDKSWPDLKDISALCKLCLSTACMGADEDMALSMAEETIKFGRTSSDADTQAVLAGALLNQSKILLSRGQKDAAVSVSAEAVTIFRAMSTTRSVFSIFLAHALDIHALHLSEVNRKSDSYSIRRDAVELWEALWISTPVPIGLPFARSLFELAKFRHKNKERTVLNEELRIARRAVDMFRQVMPLDGPGLGDALYLLADRVFELDRNGEGATYAEESVRHFREASSKDPKYALDLILSLSLASSCLACTDRADDAFEYAKQAVEVQYQREGAEDERYEAHLRKLLMDVVFRGMEIDQQDEVYPWFKELLLLGGSRGMHRISLFDR